MSDRSVAVTASGNPPDADSAASPRSTLRRLAEIATVFMLGLIFYRLLYSQMPYHDVDRFRNQVNSGHFVYDMGHIYMQPATLLWHRWLGFGESAVDSQRHINTFATALGVAIFYALLLRLKLSLWQRVIATALLAGSGNIVIMAPTAHMKFVVFPFMNAAFYLGVVWERERVRLMWLACAAMLGIAAAFLVISLATGPFATLAVLIASRRAGDTWRTSVARSLAFGAVALLLFVGLACFGFVTFTGLPLSVEGLRAAVQAKADLESPHYPAAVDVLRLIFDAANNFTAAPSLAGVGRALVSGYARLSPAYYRVLAEQLLPWMLTLALLAVIYLRAAVAFWRGATLAMPIAFLFGALAWMIFYGIDEPDHVFQMTAPTILLFLLVFPMSVKRWLLPAWTAVALTANLAFIAIPTALYPFDRYQAELQASVTPQDLVVNFIAFPGHPHAGLFKLPGVPRLELDSLEREIPDNATYFATIQQRIDAAFARGGRVFLFDVLDPDAWDAPWPELYRRHITKPVLYGFLASHYAIRSLGPVAELQTWQLSPRVTPASAPAKH